MERRLAAILAADVVGYSRLMGEDEAGTLEVLKSLRKDLVAPEITRTTAVSHSWDYAEWPLALCARSEQPCSSHRC